MNSNITPSQEQITIINAFVKGYNLQVITPAGGAKTTTSIMCITALNGKKSVLYLTYNKRLKEEIRDKVKNIPKCVGHNFHACACWLYGDNLYTDSALLTALDYKQFLFKRQFDILIVDEAQDINEIYYKFLIKIIKECEIKQIMLIGDPRQSIYGFNGGNDTYLVECGKYFPFKFCKANNNDTYRCTQAVTEFVNKGFYGDGIINSLNDKTNNKIDYHICNPYNSHDIIIKYIREYGVNDIVILAPSIKPGSQQPLIQVIDDMTEHYPDIKLYVPHDDKDEINDTSVYHNKVPFLTYHQVKGLEFKCVIVFGFDSTYDFYFNKDNVMKPNPIYVALTRAMEKLAIIASDIYNKKMGCKITAYKTINYEKIKHLIELHVDRGNGMSHFNISDNNSLCNIDQPLNYAVTYVDKYMDGNLINKCIEQMTIIESQYRSDENNINKIANMGETKEDISMYYGITIPILYVFLKQRELPHIDDVITEDFEHNVGNMGCNKVVKIKSMVKNLYDNIYDDNHKNNLIKNIFKLSVCIAAIDGYSHQFSQLLENGNEHIIDRQINIDFINHCVHKLNLYNIQVISVEKSLHCSAETRCKRCSRELKVKILGRTDMEDENNVYEFKVKSGLSVSDKNQAAIYSYITGKTCVLINLQTDERIEIKAKKEFLKTLIEGKNFFHELQGKSNNKTNSNSNNNDIIVIDKKLSEQFLSDYKKQNM